MPTITRAFELPLHHLDGDWSLLRECWLHGTDLANWGVQQLFRADVVRGPDQKKLPPMPRIDGRRLKGLYGLASETFGFGAGWWAGAAISASTILRNVERKYKQERLNVLWHRTQRLELYQYPTPWPVHAQSWKEASFDGSAKPCVRLALPGGTLTLQLRGGPEFGRQMAMFRQVVNGDLPRKQLVIRQQGASLSCHRPTLKDQGRECRVMVKIVADFEVPEVRSLRVLTLATDPAAFWVAEIDGRRVWVENADHIAVAMAWQASHSARLQRLGEDGKAERRMLADRLDQLQRSRERCCAKHAKRMSSWLHESAAHLAGFAQRQHVGLVLYRDEDKGYCPGFPWHKLKQLLKDKLTAAGIRCHCMTDGATPDEFLFAHSPIEDKECLESQRQNEKAGKRLLKARRRSGSHPAVSTL